jgi:hypothetical protein
MRKAILLLAALVLLAVPAEAEAQYRTELQWVRTPVVYLGLDFIAAEAVGDFSHYVDDGYGGELWVRKPVDDRGWISLRADVGFIIYGYERDPVCMAAPIGCQIQVDLTTSNNIVYGSIGPEFSIPGQVARPYVNGALGFSDLFTTSSLEEDWGGDDFGHTNHLGDGVLSAKVGGGVEFQVKGGRVPLYIDLGVRYHHNGMAEFLTKGDIVNHHDGSITIYPNRDEADLLTYRIGLTIGIPRGRDRRGR